MKELLKAIPWWRCSEQHAASETLSAAWASDMAVARTFLGFEVQECCVCSLEKRAFSQWSH